MGAQERNVCSRAAVASEAASQPDEPSHRETSLAAVPQEGGDLAKLLERDVKTKDTSTDVLAALEAALRPVEKYALRWLEQVQHQLPSTDHLCAFNFGSCLVWGRSTCWLQYLTARRYFQD